MNEDILILETWFTDFGAFEDQMFSWIHLSNVVIIASFKAFFTSFVDYFNNSLPWPLFLTR